MHLGISVDGPKFLHDHFRRYWSGKPTHDLITDNLSYLQKHKVNYYGLCTLTNNSLDYPEEIFYYFMQNKFSRLGFNISEIKTANKNDYISSREDSLIRIKEKLTTFMNRFYDLWVENKKPFIVREFDYYDSYIQITQDNPLFSLSDPSNKPLELLTIARNGDMSTFSCELIDGTNEDPNQFIIGNIHKIDRLEEVFLNKKLIQMREEINSGVSKCKSSCDYFKVCGGGTAVSKYYEHKTFNSSVTKYCELQIKSIADVCFFKKGLSI